jgi:hypothetical protein
MLAVGDTFAEWFKSRNRSTRFFGNLVQQCEHL